jgi:hypothetical protein
VQEPITTAIWGLVLARRAPNLGDSLVGHVGLVEEDLAEVLPVGEDLCLARQVGAPAVNQVDAGQPVLLGDFLGPEKKTDSSTVTNRST